MYMEPLEQERMGELLKSLQGLKQVSKQWHEKFEMTLTTAGFVVNEADKGVILCLLMAY